MRAFAALCLLALPGCQVLAGVGDRSVHSGECSLDKECDSGKICLLGACSDECSANSDCPRGERCLVSNDSSACVTARQAECDADADCPNGTTCFAGECQTECTGFASGCADDQICENGVCVSETDTPSIGGAGPGPAGGAGPGPAPMGGGGPGPGTGGAPGVDPAPSCGLVQPCGGDLLGTWDWAAACTNLTLASQGFAEGFCDGAEVRVSDLVLDGTVTFRSDGTMTTTGSRTDLNTFYLPTECVITTCSEFSTDLAANSDGTEGFVGCFDAAPNGCECSYQSSFGPSTTEGSYDAYDTTLDILDEDGFFSTFEYCVDGDYLHWAEPDDLNRIVYDRVAIRR